MLLTAHATRLWIKRRLFGPDDALGASDAPKALFGPKKGLRGPKALWCPKAFSCEALGTEGSFRRADRFRPIESSVAQF